MINVEALLTLTTHEAELEDIIEFWQGTGLDTSGWSPLDFERAYAELWAEMSSRLKNTLPGATIRNFYVETATGIALTYIASSMFDIDRIPAVGTQGDITLTDTGGTGPHSITTAHAFRDPLSGLTYHVLAGDTLPGSGSVTVSVQCDSPGSAGNVANASITEMVTSIAGVTVTNGTAGGASWITRLGSNYEKDPVLRQRCRTKFATFSPNSPRSAYENMVLSATDGVGAPVGIVKPWVNADNPGGPGTVWIYIANQTATATGTQVTDVQAFIDADRVSPASIPTVIAATEVPVDIYAALYVNAGHAATAEASVREAWEVYIQGDDDPESENIGLPLGGKQLDSTPGGAGFVLLSDLIDLARAVTGVVDVQMATPAGNLPVGGNELATVGTINITVVEI